jgi:hypothetical protein
MAFLGVLKPKGATKSRANADVENAEKVKEGSGQTAGNSLQSQDINSFFSMRLTWLSCDQAF